MRKNSQGNIYGATSSSHASSSLQSSTNSNNQHYQSQSTLKTASNLTHKSEKTQSKSNQKLAMAQSPQSNLIKPQPYMLQYGSDQQNDSSLIQSECTQNPAANMEYDSNKENMMVIQAHYQQYLQLQQQNNSGSQYYQLQQKNSLNSNNFHSSDLSLSQSSHQSDLSRGASDNKLKGSLQNSSVNSKTNQGSNAPPSFFKNIVTRKPLQQVHTLPSQNQPMLIPNDLQNMSPISSSSYEGLQSISNISQSMIIHQEQLQRTSSNQNTLQSLENYGNGQGSLDLSQSTTSHNNNLQIKMMSQNHLQQLNSIHKHLRFDSVQSSGQSSMILNDNIANGNNLYCDFIPALASPQLSSQSQSRDLIPSDRQQQQQCASSNMLSPQSFQVQPNSHQNIGQHYYDYLMAQQQMREEQQQLVNSHLNNSLLACMDPLGGYDSAKNHQAHSNFSSPDQYQSAAEQSSVVVQGDNSSMYTSSANGSYPLRTPYTDSMMGQSQNRQKEEDPETYQIETIKSSQVSNKHISSKGLQSSDGLNLQGRPPVQVLDAAGQTPSMALSSKDSFRESSPELLGSKEGRRRLQLRNESYLRDSHNQSRPLSSFKDVSPKVCNIVLPLNKGFCDQTIKQTLSNEAEENLEGTSSFQGLINNQVITHQQHQLLKSQELPPVQMSDLVSPDQHRTLIPSKVAPNMFSPNQQKLIESKISSNIESPMPPVTDPKAAEGGKINIGVVRVQDFSRKYLKEGGMWPSKQASQTIDYSQRQSIDRHSVSSNVQILQTKTTNDHKTFHEETRFKPYNNTSQSFKGGNLTERGNEQNLQQHKHSLSISRTIDLVPLSLMQGGGNQYVSQSQTSLYPALPDMSIVHKINSTLDNNYYRGAAGKAQLLRSSTSSCSNNTTSNNSQYCLKKPSEHVGLGGGAGASTNNMFTQRNQSLSQHVSAVEGVLDQTTRVGMNQLNSRNSGVAAPHQKSLTLSTEQHNQMMMLTTQTSVTMGGGGGKAPTHQHHQTQIQYPQLLDTLNNQHQQLHLNFIPGSPPPAQQECCRECQFEREKRSVTQHAFEKAMSISMYLMEEIEKLSYNHDSNQEMLAVSRQDILNLLKCQQPDHQQYNSGNSTQYQSNPQQYRFFSRSKSQNMMNGEVSQGQGNTSSSSIQQMQQNQTMLVNIIPGKIGQEQSPIISQSILKANNGGGVNVTQISSLQATKKRNLF